MSDKEPGWLNRWPGEILRLPGTGLNLHRGVTKEFVWWLDLIWEKFVWGVISDPGTFFSDHLANGDPNLLRHSLEEDVNF